MSVRARSALWNDALTLVKTRGYQRRDEPFLLASGEYSHDYIDGKLAVGDGTSLRTVCEAIVEVADREGVSFTAVGGLTMGADPFAHGVAMVTGCSWFSVRKEPKGRGLNAWIEGARLSSTDRVLLLDDVISTGGSTLKAYEKVLEKGATVVLVVPMVDRGDIARTAFAEHGIPYAPLLTYRDLEIEPVRGRPGA